MQVSYSTIHKDFRLNGIQYSRKELKEVAYNLVKEGEAFEQSIGDFLIDWLDSKPSMEIQTSGSTGEPKSIGLRKQHMVNSAEATGEYFKLNPGSTALLCLPANFIAGKMMLVRAMVLGLKLDCMVPSSNPLEQNSKNYDFCAMVPLQVENSLNALSCIKTLLVGGAPVSNKLNARIQKQVRKTEVFETYGMTETITHVAVKRLNIITLSEIAGHGRGTAEVVKNTQPTKSENTFRALPNIYFSIDKRNCLVIEAPNVSDAPISTNDVVNLISKTEFEWLGRYDNVINSGGIKLFPEQIEAKLEPIMESRFFVAGLPDEKLGEKLVLVVEGNTDSDKLLQEIKLLKALQKFEIPKMIYSIEGFLETANGKIRRKETLDFLNF